MINQQYIGAASHRSFAGSINMGIFQPAMLVYQRVAAEPGEVVVVDLLFSGRQQTILGCLVDIFFWGVAKTLLIIGK